MTLAARTGGSQDEIIFTNDALIAEQKEKNSKKNQEKSQQKKEDVENHKRAFYVTSEECNKECTSFTKDTEGWRYCANVCGIIRENHDTSICDDKVALSRDYCLMQKSRNEKDIDSCDQISDKGIREKCIQQTKEQILDAF